jgi:hypothetical protein
MLLLVPILNHDAHSRRLKVYPDASLLLVKFPSETRQRDDLNLAEMINNAI